jgi:hypothetical protein
MLSPARPSPAACAPQSPDDRTSSGPPSRTTTELFRQLDEELWREETRFNQQRMDEVIAEGATAPTRRRTSPLQQPMGVHDWPVLRCPPRPFRPIPAAFRYALAISRRTPVAAWMRRSGQPSRPNARTCCCLYSPKMLAMSAGRPSPLAAVNVLGRRYLTGRELDPRPYPRVRVVSPKDRFPASGGAGASASRDDHSETRSVPRDGSIGRIWTPADRPR